MWIRGVFSFSEVRISTAGQERTIGRYTDYPDADDELKAGSLVFRQGEVASKERGEGQGMIHGPPNYPHQSYTHRKQLFNKALLRDNGGLITP